jgi:hypothetical protein
MIGPPDKPFASYKWRWATLTPTEGLNEPPIFLGVLRALAANEGDSKSSAALQRSLQTVATETRNRVDTTLNLRSGDRNLLRNSGQYWTGLRVLSGRSGVIELTDFGRRVAAGLITRDEFAAAIVRTLELPNRAIQTDVAAWDSAGLRIKPLQLLLDILQRLRSVRNQQEAYITPRELVKIIIPLAGVKSDVATHAEAVLSARAGRLSLVGWPDCAPEANDRRMAREFLLFLHYYGFCDLRKRGTNDQDEYGLVLNSESAIQTLLSAPVVGPDARAAVDVLRHNAALPLLERTRTMVNVWSRPAQPRFRRDILEMFDTRCVVSGETLADALEAAHIIPVPNNGPDTRDNGLCLRADIHNLFDAGHIAISSTGDLRLSEAAQGSTAYSRLPRRITVPSVVCPALDWRWKYL